jgi:HEAT repeat protein
LTCYCPNCWIQTEPDDQACPGCGFRMAAFDSLGYQGKLLLALKHPVREHRMLAIQLLGEIKSQSAVTAFGTIIEQEEDTYVLREIALALACIGGAASRGLLERLASQPSVIARRAAEDALGSLRPGGS